MSDFSCIYWFSGTGNSLRAAKILAGELGGMRLEQITDAAPPDAIGGDGETVGFVFPSYYSNMPRAVRAFVEKTAIKPGTYVFAIVTMGGMGQGSVASLESLLKSKGSQLDYGRSLRMPANYVINYNPADPDKSGKLLGKAGKNLAAFAVEIAARTQSVKKIKLSANNLYVNVEKLDSAFAVGSGCNGCGMCVKVCPVHNISMVDEKPEWQRHCERCMACISWCPKKAIDYGDKTKARRRYRNPEVTSDDLVRKEPANV